MLPTKSPAPSAMEMMIKSVIRAFGIEPQFITSAVSDLQKLAVDIETNSASINLRLARIEKALGIVEPENTEKDKPNE